MKTVGAARSGVSAGRLDNGVSSKRVPAKVRKPPTGAIPMDRRVGLHDDCVMRVANFVDQELGAVSPRAREPEDRYAQRRRREQRYSAWAA
jgi:hypothetical protein